MRALILSAVDESVAVKQQLKELAEPIERTALAAIAALRQGGKIVFCGNGGSAADAQHLAAELVGKFMRARQALPALALTTNTSILTAIANDLSYEQVFARQVEGLMSERDVLVGISTSGESPNILAAVQAARRKGALTVALTGGSGGQLAALVDLALVVPSPSTPRIQEAHITIGHILCELIERGLCEEHSASRSQPSVALAGD